MAPRFAVPVLALVLIVALNTGVHSQSPEQRMVEAQLAAPKLVEGPVNLDLPAAPLKDVVAAIAKAGGITVRYHSAVAGLDTIAAVKLEKSTVADALKTTLAGRALALKATGSRSVFVYPDTPANREKYTDAVRTFPIAKADVNTLMTFLNGALTTGPDDLRPTIVSMKVPPTVSVRATPDVMAKIAKLIADNDKSDLPDQQTPVLEYLITPHIFEASADGARSTDLIGPLLLRTRAGGTPVYATFDVTSRPRR